MHACSTEFGILNRLSGRIISHCSTSNKFKNQKSESFLFRKNFSLAGCELVEISPHKTLEPFLCRNFLLNVQSLLVVKVGLQSGIKDTKAGSSFPLPQNQKPVR
eukprot:Pompholyxophrys_punicea_v1_NODE_559_length_1691_cov_2.544010.p2 type:complete len:104 gc:universal NODE_559_length_1691_cov_2.544010:581-892(+)